MPVTRSDKQQAKVDRPWVRYTRRWVEVFVGVMIGMPAGGATYEAVSTSNVSLPTLGLLISAVYGATMLTLLYWALVSKEST